MKIKHLVCIIFIIILILFTCDLKVKGAEYGTYFYEVPGKKTELGFQWNFSKPQWYESYNIFCVLSGGKTPTELTAEARIEFNSPTPTDPFSCSKTDECDLSGLKNLEQKSMIKIAYIFSRLEEWKGDVVNRKNNFETAPQQAIWKILGQDLPTVATENDKTSEVLDEADAYYNFWMNDRSNQNATIITSAVQYTTNKYGTFYGPFKIEYKTQSTNSCEYGNITKIEIMDEAGEYVDVSDKLVYTSDKIFPKSNEDFYIMTDTQIKKIRVSFNDSIIKSGYLVYGIGGEGQQDSLFGSVDRSDPTQIEADVNLNKLEFYLSKIDSETNANLSDVKFNYGLYNENFQLISDDGIVKIDGVVSNTVKDNNGWRVFKTSGSNMKFEISNLNGNVFYLVLQETEANGYNKIGYDMCVKFVKQNETWTATTGKATWDTDEGKYKFETYKDDKVNYENNTLTIKNEKTQLEFNLSKVGLDTKANLSGVTFNYAVYKEVTNTLKNTTTLESINNEVRGTVDGSDSGVDNNGWRTFTTKESNSVIQISNIRDNTVWLVFKETVPAVGYKLIDSYIAIKFKDGNMTGDIKKALFNDVYSDISLIEVRDLDDATNKLISVKNNTLNITNEKEDQAFSFTLKKIHEYSKNSMKGVEFTVTYEYNDKSTTANCKTDKNGEVEISVGETDAENVTITISETTPKGFYPLGYSIRLVFEKDNEGNWICVGDTSEIAEGVKIKHEWTSNENENTSENTNTSKNTNIGTLKIKNRPKASDGEHFNINIEKINEAGASLFGSKFTIVAEGGTLMGTYDSLIDIIPENFGNIEVYPNSESTPVKLKITETNPPTGYDVLIPTVTVEYTYKDGEWVGNLDNSVNDSVKIEDYTIKFINYLIIGDHLAFNLTKIDPDGNNGVLSGATFSIIDVKNGNLKTSSEITIGSGNVEISTPSGATEVEVTLEETKAPEGYNKIDGEIKIKFTKKDDKWQAVLLTESVSDSVKIEENNIVGIKISNKQDGIPITFKKTNLEGTQIEGAKFKVEVENGEIKLEDKTSKETNIEIGSKTVTIIPTNQEKDVIVTFTETNAPEGYKKLIESAKVKYKYSTEEKKWKGELIDIDTNYIEMNDNTITIKNKLDIKSFDITVKKVNENGNSLNGATFSVGVTNGTANVQEITIGSKTITITPKSLEDVTVTFTEETAPAGYKAGGSYEVTYKYQDGEWKLKESSTGIIADGNNIAIINDQDTTSWKIPINVQKIKENGESLSGATFEVTVENGAVDNSTITIGSKTITVTPTSINDPVTVTFEEIEAPAGYQIGGPYEVTYSYQNSKWELVNRSSEIVKKDNNTIKIKNHPSITIGNDTITGKVFLDGFSGVKGAESPNGSWDDDEPGIKGVKVILKQGEEEKAYTVTDDNGGYSFSGIERGVDYTVVFEYDGVNYEATTPSSPKKEMSQASEKDIDRGAFNGNFTTIEFEKSNGKIYLDYYRNNETNDNPTYYGRTWILKTLDEDSKIVKENFKTTASTNFRIDNKVQYYYNVVSYSCWHDYYGKCQGVTETDYGDLWYDTEQSPNSRTPHDNQTVYYYKGTNYYIEYGTTEFPNQTRGKGYQYHTEEDQAEKLEYTLNFGLVKREVDLSLVNDLYKAEVSINGKTTIYDYEYVPLGNNETGIIEVGSDCSNDTYDYKLELTEKDFLYGTKIVDDKNATYNYENEFVKNETADKGYKEDAGQLEIYATYRIALNNQSTSKATVNNIAYYYDPKYELQKVEEGTYDKKETQEITYVEEGTQEISLNGNTKTYNKINIITTNKELGEGGQEYVYVTFKIKYNAENQIEKGLYNTIAEITSYSTPDGKVDIDSAPGNAINLDKTICDEDDTDIAPGLTIIEQGNEREIKGNVWDDSNKNTDGSYTFANGQKENGEKNIAGVIVQLIEVKEENGQKKYYIWDQTQTNGDGKYSFNNFIPGNYIVRFIYGYEPNNGDYIDVIDEWLGNVYKKYNGQDYKSTADVNYENYKQGKWYNEYHNLAENTSVARDNEARRLITSANTAEINTELGEALRDKTNLSDTYMYADTSMINIAVASMEGKEVTNNTEVKGKSSSEEVEYNKFLNVNFGLEERPKTEITLEKHITGLRITANDGTTIVDAKLYSVNGENSVIFSDNSIITGLTAFYSNREERGNWHLEADIEEVIQGATLDLEYTYTVRNKSETDYVSYILAQDFENLLKYDDDGNLTMEDYKNKLKEDYAKEISNDISSNGYNSKLGKYLGSTYYTGAVATDVTDVKTHVGKIEDYINNALKFTETQSSDFKVSETNKEENIYEISSSKEGNSEVKINQIVLSKEDIGTFLPEKTLTQTILVESNGKLTTTGVLNFPSYITQIETAYSNPVGRRDTESIPGNLKYIRDDRLENNTFGNLEIEQDSFLAEELTITKPTGANKQLIITLSIVLICGLTIICGGIFIIKKYVL